MEAAPEMFYTSKDLGKFYDGFNSAVANYASTLGLKQYDGNEYKNADGSQNIKFVLQSIPRQSLQSRGAKYYIYNGNTGLPIVDDKGNWMTYSYGENKDMKDAAVQAKLSQLGANNG